MDKYIELLKNNNYEELANINFIDDLVKYKCQDKYLIEYLLKKNIHSDKMDEYLKFHENFVPFYLKYNIIKPLLNCSLKVLLTKYKYNLLFDLILDKLTDEDKIKLYYNLRITSYNDFKLYEREIIDIYLRHGIVLPIMFVSTKLNKINEEKIDSKLINEFKELFKDTDIKLLNFLVNEFKRCLIKNRIRTINDLKKIIKFKRENPNFKFKRIDGISGKFKLDDLLIETNTKDDLMFNHEFSHLLYHIVENNSELETYEKIRKKIDTENNFLKIKAILEFIHIKYFKLKEELEQSYDDKIIKYYGSLDNYINKLYIDMKDNTPEILLLKNIENNTSFSPFITDDNLPDIVETVIEIEKKEFVLLELHKIFSPYLMLENMLDAILNGKLFDDLEFNCLSGHGSIYFQKEKSNSFDECLANYDAIKKSNEGLVIIKILKELIGDELITFLDNYIKVNREEDSYGHR